MADSKCINCNFSKKLPFNNKQINLLNSLVAFRLLNAVGLIELVIHNFSSYTMFQILKNVFELKILNSENAFDP